MERPESKQPQGKLSPSAGPAQGRAGPSSERVPNSAVVQESLVCPSCSTLLQLDPSALPRPTQSELGLGWWFSCGKCNHHWWQAATLPQRKDYERELQELRRLVGEFDLVPYSRGDNEAAPFKNVSPRRRQSRDTKEALSRSDVQRIKESLIKEVRKEIDDYTRKTLQKDVRLLDPRNRELLNSPQGSDFFPRASALWRKVFPSKAMRPTDLPQPHQPAPSDRKLHPSSAVPEEAPHQKSPAKEGSPASSPQKPEQRYSYRRVPLSELALSHRPSPKKTSPQRRAPSSEEQPSPSAQPSPQQASPLIALENGKGWLKRAQQRAEAQPRPSHEASDPSHSPISSGFFVKFRQNQKMEARLPSFETEEEKDAVRMLSQPSQPLAQPTDLAEEAPSTEPSQEASKFILPSASQLLRQPATSEAPATAQPAIQQEELTPPEVTEKHHFLWTRKPHLWSASPDAEPQTQSENCSSEEAPEDAPSTLPTTPQSQLTEAFSPQPRRRFRALSFGRRSSTLAAASAMKPSLHEASEESAKVLSELGNSAAQPVLNPRVEPLTSDSPQVEPETLEVEAPLIFGHSPKKHRRRFHPLPFRKPFKNLEGLHPDISLRSEDEESRETPAQPQQVADSKSTSHRFRWLASKKKPPVEPLAEPLVEPSESDLSAPSSELSLAAPKPKKPWHWALRGPRQKTASNEEIAPPQLPVETPEPLPSKIFAPLKKNVSFALRRRHEKVRELSPPLTLQHVLDKVDLAWREQERELKTKTSKPPKTSYIAIQEEGSTPTIVAMPTAPEWGLWPPISAQRPGKAFLRWPRRRSEPEEDAAPSRHKAYRQLLLLFSGLLLATSFVVYWTYRNKGQMTTSWKKFHYEKAPSSQLTLEQVRYTVKEATPPITTSTIVITGEIVNSQAASQPVAPINISVFAANGKIPLASWQYLHNLSRLLPFERSKFQIEHPITLPETQSEVRVELKFSAS